MAVAAGEIDHQIGHVFGQAMGILGGISDQHLGHAGHLGRLFADCGATAAGDQNGHLTTNCLGGGNRVQGCDLEFRIVVFGNDQRSHLQITFATLRSFSTSSATSATITPASRFGGSTTRSVSSRGLGSTPRSAGDIWSIGFFFAFMMFGSDA